MTQPQYLIWPVDCREAMRQFIAPQSVNTVVTSPPYFGLRDYGCDGQIGLEPTPDEFVAALVEVFREVRRVLRDDGTVWLNLGDSYAANKRGRSSTSAGFNARYHGSAAREDDKQTLAHQISHTVNTGLHGKQMLGIPWRVAFALQADGWYLRQDIIWHKPNPMPESVTDRCTKAHEYVFLLSKSPKYYFDHESIKEPLAASSVARLKQVNLPNQVGSNRVPGKTNGNMKAVGRIEPGSDADRLGVRNRRSVWTVTTKPFKGAHFATFPPDLIEPCVLAGCPEGGLVYDPFGGSGTTAIVALRNGRNAVLSELNREYVDMAHARIAGAL